MGVVIAEEPYAAFVDEVKALAPLHWEELALDRDDIPLDIDWDFYAAVEKVGSLAGYTVRKDGALIGYAAYFVRKHPRYRTSLCCQRRILGSPRPPRREDRQRIVRVH